MKSVASFKIPRIFLGAKDIGYTKSRKTTGLTTRDKHTFFYAHINNH